MDDKQKQIEEMAKAMCEEYDTDICKHECPMATDCANILIAKRLIAAGYRKTFTSALASDTQKAFKEGFEKGKAEQNAELERIKIELRQKVDYIHKQRDVIDEYKHRAEVAEKMFNILYEETSEYMKVLSKEWYKYQAEKEFAEEKKDE